MRGRIDARDARSAANVYAVFGVPGGRPDIPAVEILFRPQVSLGQRRPSERDARFPADDHDRPGETLLPQGGGYLKTVTTIKHYAANNTEGDRIGGPTDRLSGNSSMDERTLREYYTATFRTALDELGRHGAFLILVGRAASAHTMSK